MTASSATEMVAYTDQIVEYTRWLYLHLGTVFEVVIWQVGITNVWAHVQTVHWEIYQTE